jgi:hypothetical protein
MNFTSPPPIPGLTQLSYEDLERARIWITRRLDHAVTSRDELYVSYKARQEAEAAARRVAAEKQAAKAAELAAKVEKWAEANLKPGMRVKMAGCRDGNGIRDVLRIFPGGTVECRQVLLRRSWNRDAKAFDVSESLGGITTHSPSKIRGVLWRGKWVKIGDLL